MSSLEHDVPGLVAAAGQDVAAARVGKHNEYQVMGCHGQVLLLGPSAGLGVEVVGFLLPLVLAP